MHNATLSVKEILLDNKVIILIDGKVVSVIDGVLSVDNVAVFSLKDGKLNNDV